MRPRTAWAPRPWPQSLGQTGPRAGLRRRGQIDDGPPRTGLRVPAEQAAHTSDRRAGLRDRVRPRPVEPRVVRRRRRAMLWQARSGPLLPAHHPGTPVSGSNECRGRHVAQRDRSYRPTILERPRRLPSGCPTRACDNRRRTAPTGPPSWNAWRLPSGAARQSRPERPLLPAHHPGTPESGSYGVGGPDHCFNRRREPLLPAHHPGTPWLPEVCADKRRSGPPLPAHHSGTLRQWLVHRRYPPASAKRTAPTGPPSWNAESGAHRAPDKAGKERPYRSTPRKRQERVRQRGEIDLSRRQRLMGLRDDLCLPSCHRRRYRRYSHEDASSSK